MSGVALFWCLLFLLMSSSGLQAEPVSLGKITVTATRTEIPLKEVPASVSVLTRSDLAQKHLRTIDEALKNEAGVYLRRRKGLMDSLASVTLRGIPDQKRTLVLLDGVPINEGYEGEVAWSVLSTEDVARLEVVRGPYSSLWGGNAMGGVVSLFSWLPQRLTCWAKAGIGNGEEVTQSYRLGLGNKLGDFSFLLGFEKDNDLGYPTTPVVRTPKSGSGYLVGGYPTTDPTGEKLKWVVGDKGNNWGKRENYHASLGWAFSQTGLLKISWQHGWTSYGYGPPHTYVKDANGTPAFSGKVALPQGEYVSVYPSSFIYYAGIGYQRNDFLVLNFKQGFGSALLRATLGYTGRDSYWTKPLSGGYYTATGEINLTDVDTYYLDFSATHQLFQKHLVTTGVTFRHDQADVHTRELAFYRDPSSQGVETYQAGGDIENLGLFLQDNWTLRPDWHLIGGIRYDHWWTHGGYAGSPATVESYPARQTGTLSPKMALVWHPYDTTTLRLSYGKAFRAPNIYELYRTWTSSWGTTYHGNPDLGPERAYSWEFGLSQGWAQDRLHLDLSLFRTRLRGMIYRMSQGSDKYWVNAGTGEIYGLEAAFKVRPRPWCLAELNFTRNDTKVVSNPADPDSEGKRFVKTPPWMWNLHLGLEKSPLSLNLWGHYVGKIFYEEDNSDVAEGVYGTAESHVVVDLKSSFVLPAHLPGAQLVLSLAVNNLFDADYWDYYRAPGRTWFLSVELKHLKNKNF